jgi:putrescine aminotransferase
MTSLTEALAAEPALVPPGLPVAPAQREPEAQETQEAPRSAREVIDVYRRHVSVGRARLADLLGGHMEVRSAGPYLYTADGERFLNAGGYGVFLMGHCHPKVVEAVVQQVRTHPLSSRMLLEARMADAAAALVRTTPPGLDYVHFVNSGAEATEAALKLARALGKKTLVSAERGYHGKTLGALSITANRLYQDPFKPLLPDVHHVPFGDAAALAETLAARPGECCVVLEPVQGEGGVHIPPEGYLREVADLCWQYDALFVLDEIQTGLGRLGTCWGADAEGVTPDVLLVGKGLSGGVIPVAAMVATAQAYLPFNLDPYLHTSTFAGSPVAMAAAEAAVRVLEEEGLVERARTLGERLLRELRHICHRYPPLVRELRGRGLLIGLDMTDESLVGELALELMERNVIVNHSLNAHCVLRLTPPAVMSDGDCTWLISAMDEAMAAVAARQDNELEKTCAR